MINLFTFKGRIGRLKFVVIVFSLILSISIYLTFFIEAPFIISFVFMIGFLWIASATNAKRFHDFGLSGWWQMLIIIPIISLIVTALLVLKSGDAGANRYGSRPGHSGFYELI